MFKSLRKWIHDKYGIWFHAQNLMECPKCGTAQGIAWYGRNWLHFSDRKGFSTCWLWFMKRIDSLSVSFAIGGGDSEDHLTFHVSVPYLFSLWWTAEGFIPSQVRKVEGHYLDFSRTWEMRYDLKFGTWGSLWWKFGARDDASDFNYRNSRWREGTFDPADFVLGSPVYRNENIGAAQKFLIRLPDGAHPVTVQMEQATWKRPRWPWAKTIRRAEVTSEKGVPIPGKGENSWDCGDDATFGMTMAVDSPSEAVDRFTADILETRRRHGGSALWKPESGAVAE